MPKPPIVVDFAWNGHLEFVARTGRSQMALDSAGLTGLSPVEALGAALGGCMATDLGHILTRGRHPFTALRARLVAERAATEPHRLLSVALHFTIEGSVPAAAVERAIALSRDKYCSVWHSLRGDISFQVTFDLVA
jgi:putative redox protein